MRSIRHYEERALIASTRSASGQRHFDADTVERVHLIRKLLAAGLATRAIADVLPCLSDPSSQTVKLTERLLEERDRLSDEIRVRGEMLEALNRVIDAAPPSRCPTPALSFPNGITRV